MGLVSGDTMSEIFVDAYLNEGFSGAPVYGYPALLRGSGAKRDLTIVGVVTHYVPEHKPVVLNAEKTALTAEHNPGIAVVADVRYALDAIHSFGPWRGAPFRAPTE